MLAILPAIAVLAATSAAPAPAPEVLRAAALKLDIRDAHLAPTNAGGSVAVSMLLTNPTSTTVVLVGATTPMAGQTSLQKYVKDAGGLLQVAPVSNVVIPPGAETLFAPGTLELQLVGTTTDLERGLELPLTLKFADGTQRVLRLKVEGDE